MSQQYSQKSLNRSYRAVFLSCLLWNAQPHLVVFTIFILSKGFSLYDFFIIESAAALVALLAEIPTGIVADRVGRKISLLVSTAIAIFGTIVIILSSDFSTILIATAIGGLAGALRSGADVALFYDSLKMLGRENEFARENGTLRWWSGIVGAAASITGGLLAFQNLATAWWAWLCIVVATFVCLCFAIEPNHPTEDKTHDSLLHLKQSLHITFRSKASFFIWYAVSTWFFFSIGFWLWQPYLISVEIPVEYFGVLYAVIGVVSGFGSKFVGSSQMSTPTLVLAIPLLLTLSFFLQAESFALVGCGVLLLHGFASGMFGVLTDQLINQSIPSSKRATVLSVKNMLSTLLFLSISPWIGWIVGAYTLSFAYILMGCMLILLGFGFRFLYKSRP